MDYFHVHDELVDCHNKLFDSHCMIVDLHQIKAYPDIENESHFHLYIQNKLKKENFINNSCNKLLFFHLDNYPDQVNFLGMHMDCFLLEQEVVITID